MSTLALEGSEAAGSTGGRAGVLRYADLGLLAVALGVFVLADLPLAGYAVAAVAWLGQHALLALSERGAAAALARADRRRAIGIVGAITLARVWLVTAAILLVGLLGEREDGLAAAILSAALVTLHLAATAVSRLLEPGPGR